MLALFMLVSIAGVAVSATVGAAVAAPLLLTSALMVLEVFFFAQKPIEIKRNFKTSSSFSFFKTRNSGTDKIEVNSISISQNKKRLSYLSKLLSTEQQYLRRWALENDVARLHRALSSEVTDLLNKGGRGNEYDFNTISKTPHRLSNAEKGQHKVLASLVSYSSEPGGIATHSSSFLSGLRHTFFSVMISLGVVWSFHELITRQEQTAVFFHFSGESRLQN